MKNVYQDHQVTFYCGCKYKKNKIDFSACGYTPKENPKRALRMEWEHIVPAQAFGQSFDSWRNGHPKCVKKNGKPFKGRKCAEKVSPEFSNMAGDPYNLVPSIGEVNGFRSNFSMAVIPGEKRDFGECDIEIKNGKFEPKESIRGDIARIYFYMDSTYPGKGIISKRSRKLFDAWDKSDPVDYLECDRYNRIKKIFRLENSILVDRCQKLLSVS